MDQKRLIAGVLAGDPAAERRLYDQHVDRVFRLAFRLTGDDELARETTQETFIRAFDRMSEFRGEAALSTWLYAITRSVGLNLIRKVKRIQSREMNLDDAFQKAARGEAEPDLKARLHSAIDELPEKYRTVFVMHEIEGFKHEEIAEILGLKVGTSKAQLSRARAKLKESLAPFAGEWAS